MGKDSKTSAPIMKWNASNDEGHYSVAYEFRNTELRRDDKIVATDLTELYDVDPTVGNQDTPVLTYDTVSEMWIVGEAPSGECLIYDFPTASLPLPSYFFTQEIWMLLQKSCRSLLNGGVVQAGSYGYVLYTADISFPRADQLDYNNTMIYKRPTIEEIVAFDDRVQYAHDMDLSSYGSDYGIYIASMVFDNDDPGKFDRRFVLRRELIDFMLGDEKIVSISYEITPEVAYANYYTEAVVCLTESGRIIGYGDNKYSQLFDFKPSRYTSVPVKYVSTTSGWIKATVGNDARKLFVIHEDGNMWVRGYVRKTDNDTDKWCNAGAFDAERYTNIDNIPYIPTFYRITVEDDAYNDVKWVDVFHNDLGSVALKEDGTLWKTFHGEARDGYMWYVLYPYFRKINDWTWISIAMTDRGFIGIRSDGTAWSTGNDVYGELGGIDVNNLVDEFYQIGTDTDWVEAYSGVFRSCLKKADGTLWLLGNNSPYGTLNRPPEDVYSSSVPLKLNDDTDWKYARLSSLYSFFIKNDGSIWYCGYNKNEPDSYTLLTEYRYDLNTSFVDKKSVYNTNHATTLKDKTIHIEPLAYYDRVNVLYIHDSPITANTVYEVPTEFEPIAQRYYGEDFGGRYTGLVLDNAVISSNGFPPRKCLNASYAKTPGTNRSYIEMEMSNNSTIINSYDVYSTYTSYSIMRNGCVVILDVPPYIFQNLLLKQIRYFLYTPEKIISPDPKELQGNTSMILQSKYRKVNNIYNFVTINNSYRPTQIP